MLRSKIKKSLYYVSDCNIAVHSRMSLDSFNSAGVKSLDIAECAIYPDWHGGIFRRSTKTTLEASFVIY